MATTGLPTPTVSSTSDMLSASLLPGDVLAGFSSGDDSGADDTVDTSDAGDEAGDDAGPAIGDEPAGDEPLEADGDEAEPEPAEAAPAKETGDKKADPADEELPEGVRKGKDRKGKEGYFLEENRYKTFHGNHQIVKQAAELMGEPLTVEALQVRNEALRNNERLYNDLSSGEPALQSNVVNDLLTQMGEAAKRGEVGIDPTVPFAQTVFSAIREKSPDGYASLMQMAARDLVTQLYDVAARNSDGNVASSAQRIAAVLSGVEPKPDGWTDQEYAAYARNKIAENGFDFHTHEELPKLLQERPARGQDLAAENARLKAQLEGRTEASPAAQFDSWQKESAKAVTSSILDKVVKPALAGVEDKWKEFPNDYNDLVVDRLNRLVTKDVRSDTELNQRIQELTTRARRATSAQVRAEIAARIQSEFVNRANQAVERHKADVLKFAAQSLQGRSDATHERRNGAQNRTAPKGPSAPVKRSLAPVPLAGPKDGNYDRSFAYKQAMALLSA